MRPYSKTLEGYLLKAKDIMAQLVLHHNQPEAMRLLQHMSNTLDAIEVNPIGDRYMDFSEYNTRYGYANSIVGIVGETISALNLLDISDGPIRIATSDIDQDINATDIWFSIGSVQQSVQVKSVIISKDILTRPTQYLNIKTDWISLVDIDDYHHYLCTPAAFALLLSNGTPTHSSLLSIGTYWNNTMSYGTRSDKLVYKTRCSGNV